MFNSPYASQVALQQNTPSQPTYQTLAQQPVQQQPSVQPMQQINEQVLRQYIQQQVQQALQAQAGSVQQYSEQIIQTLVDQRIAAHLQGVRAEMDAVKSSNSGPSGMSVDWPSQFKMGAIEYPGLTPFPIPMVQEMLAPDSTRFGVTNDRCIATFQTESGTPNYLAAVRFDIMKTANEQGATDPLGTFLALSATRSPYYDRANQVYIGRDFLWNMQTNAQNLLWQKGDIPSAQADGDDRFGYRMPIEVKFSQGETIEISATPTAPVVAGAEWRLFCTLFIYKMVDRYQLLGVPTAREIRQAKDLQAAAGTGVSQFPPRLQVG